MDETDKQAQILRRKENDNREELRSETRAWLAQLPPSLELPSLARQFPRIANQVADLWNKPAQCERYLDGLIFNDRTGFRQGFPTEVCLEIMRLKSLLTEICEEKRKATQSQSYDVWEKS